MHESAGAAPPTPYPDVNDALRFFVARLPAILSDALIGIYLYGSLAQGDFDPDSSDIDLVVVTAREVTEGQFAALGALHDDFRAGGSPWAEKIEAAYIRKEALHLSPAGSAAYPQLEKGRELAREPLEIGWPFQRAVLRDHGIVLAGPDPATLMDPVPARELAEADLAIVRMWREQRRADPTWLPWVRERSAQRFVVVTLCRALYTREHGTLVSKTVAARWGREALDGRWAALIARSIARGQSETLVPDTDLADILAFLDYTAARLGARSER